MRKAIVFSIMSVVFAFAVVLFFLNFQFFVAESGRVLQEDTEIGVGFATIERDVNEIIDVKTDITKNSTHTTINITDKFPREGSINKSLRAYDDFLNNHLNLSYNVTANFTGFFDEPEIDISGINASYVWGNFTKANVTLVQRKGRDTSADFVKKYRVNITPRDTTRFDTLSRVNDSVDSGNLHLTIHAANASGSDTQIEEDVSRDGLSFFVFNYTGNNDPGGRIVNVSVGTIQHAGNEFNASLSIVPELDIRAATILVVKDNEIG